MSGNSEKFFMERQPGDGNSISGFPVRLGGADSFAVEKSSTEGVLSNLHKHLGNRSVLAGKLYKVFLALNLYSNVKSEKT